MNRSSAADVICFKHCNNESSIFCKNLPTVCPLCKSAVTAYILEPFRVVYPFGQATQTPCGVFVKPSIGTFLRDYQVTNDLHVGLTDSAGRIFEFDRLGFRIDSSSEWSDCLLCWDALPESWKFRWDEVLEETSERWKRRDYDDVSANCFDFVSDFFQSLRYVSLIYPGKRRFCDLFVLPKLRRALGYVSLHRNLMLSECYVPSLDSDEST